MAEANFNGDYPAPGDVAAFMAKVAESRRARGEDPSLPPPLLDAVKRVNILSGRLLHIGLGSPLPSFPKDKPGDIVAIASALQVACSDLAIASLRDTGLIDPSTEQAPRV